MKKLILGIIVATALGAFAIPMAFAEEGSSANGNKQVRQEIKETKKAFHKEVKEEKKDLREKIKDLRKDLKASAEGKVKKLKAKAGHLLGATITAINGSTFTVTKDGKTYTVNTSSDSKFRRHFWGKSGLNEFSVGNKINAWGKWTDETQTTLDAKMIRNLSIMKRHGVFLGQITSLGAGSFVINSKNRGEQTIFYTATTKFEDRKGATITASNLKTGDKVRVKGLWDKSNKKVTEVTQVKDFSLPAKASKTPTPSAAVTVTATATLTPTP